VNNFVGNSTEFSISVSRIELAMFGVSDTTAYSKLFGDVILTAGVMMTGYKLDGRVSIHDRDKIFHPSIASRPALRPTQPPIQWVPGALSAGVKRPRREVDH
jgi:hypothetical protein